MFILETYILYRNNLYHANLALPNIGSLYHDKAAFNHYFHYFEILPFTNLKFTKSFRKYRLKGRYSFNHKTLRPKFSKTLVIAKSRV